jgi:hypothetical protein
MKDSEKLLITGLLIVLFAWLTWTAYWNTKLYASLFLLAGVTDLFGKQFLSTTLSTTFLFVGLTVRTIAAVLAILTVLRYYRKGWSTGVRNMVGAVIALEVVYLISNVPQAWVGPDVNDFVLIPETTIPAIVDGIILPIPLIILAIRLRWQGKTGSVARWACISGVTYILALCVRYSGQWIATFIQTEKYTTFFGGFPAHGLSYILNYPLNMFSFILTVVGLPLLAVFLLVVSLPAVRNLGAPLDMHRIGLVATLFGVYFMVALFMLYALPGYVGAKAIWGTFFIGHNVDLWIFALPMIGIPLMLGAAEKNKAD